MQDVSTIEKAFVMNQTSGGQLVAETLKTHGVRHLFTLCGGHISPILVGCRQIGIQVVDVRHEVSAVFAADAMARLTGTPGVAAVTAGPGVTNTITALKNAQMAHSPVVLLGGAAATVLKGRGSLQDIDHLALVRSICKTSVSIRRYADIIKVLSKAFQTACSGVPGPVFVECPIDLLYNEAVVREMYGAKSRGASSQGVGDRLLQWYLNFHLARMFRGTVAGPPAPLPVSRPTLSPSRVAAAVKAVQAAKRPVLIIGSQAMLDPAQAQSLATAVSQLKMPVYLAGMARGLMGPGSELQMRHRRSAALARADLVVLAGMPCDFRLNYGRSFSSKSTLVGINRDRKALYLNRRPDIALHADPHEGLCAIAREAAVSDDRWRQWKDALQEADAQREKEIENMAGVATSGVNPIELLRRLETFLTDKSILVADGGDFVATAAYCLKPRGPLRWLDPGAFGTLGVGAGFAMGAQLADPGAEVWLIYGDGAAGYSLQEFDTFVRHGLPVIAVVGNDGAWAQIARDQVKYLRDDVGTVLRPCDYHVVAEGFGARGFLLEDANEIIPTFEAARAEAGKGRPVLINVRIGRTDFREGSISM